MAADSGVVGRGGGSSFIVKRYGVVGIKIPPLEILDIQWYNSFPFKSKKRLKYH